MNLFQFFALLVVALLLVGSVVAAVRGSLSRRDSALWILLWLAAGVAILWPDVTRVVARWLGIGRGADLILYSAVVVMLAGFLMTYTRLRRLQRDLTVVVRHLALRDPSVDPSKLAQRDADAPNRPTDPASAAPPVE